ncbi:glutaredoxin family protein [Methylovorus mays]|uniref:glutaredoxin family protein n=1 Tax=Methylovorus mays TaxID=184077 RepID=UPI001E2D032B|nr:glutaredoxin family protein [Methylovorus mays]MCB5205731.1 glutaredoxin family protein [Methylovorus mays]
MELFKVNENLKFITQGNLPPLHPHDGYKRMIQLKLYGTEGCHLCDHAFELITQATQPYDNITLHYIDIIEDEELMNAYGTKIPVLTVPDKTNLYWPFSIGEITQLIESAQ